MGYIGYRSYLVQMTCILVLLFIALWFAGLTSYAGESLIVMVRGEFGRWVEDLVGLDALTALASLSPLAIHAFIGACVWVFMAISGVLLCHVYKDRGYWR